MLLLATLPLPEKVQRTWRSGHAQQLYEQTEVGLTPGPDFFHPQDSRKSLSTRSVLLEVKNRKADVIQSWISHYCSLPHSFLTSPPNLTSLKSLPLRYGWSVLVFQGNLHFPARKYWTLPDTYDKSISHSHSAFPGRWENSWDAAWKTQPAFGEIRYINITFNRMFFSQKASNWPFTGFKPAHPCRGRQHLWSPSPAAAWLFWGRTHFHWTVVKSLISNVARLVGFFPQMWV